MTENLNKPKIGRAAKISLAVIIAALLVVVSYFAGYMDQADQAVFAIIFTLGVLSVGSTGSALLISTIGGVAYSFVSPSLGFIMLLPWIVRGLSTDALMWGLGIFKQNSYPSIAKVTIAMIISSFLTGLASYFWLIKFLKVIPDSPLVTLSTEIAIVIAIVSTAIATPLTVRYLYRRIEPILPW